ncbi:hypothetical protein [Sphingomonas xanthus]|uniref:Uncharacterized protein n=1 Tax=Sphingomonas xanthus TaxID=2594473 RepID=A0A516IQ71_9SPHN|nr:hypothetical protein [Sphingomonas xanthus]QDP19063.1 hypothetical protein FMM02_03265 [Sphingomonas xanthus]
MFDDILLEDLAASPPQVWAQRNEQAEVIGPLASLSKLTVADAERARAELQISRRYLYQLVKARRERLNGLPARGHGTGAQFHIDECQERIIAQAIDRAGPAARHRDVLALAMSMSEQVGIAPPSEKAVRVRFGKHRPNIDLASRFKLECDYIADLCPLGLALADEKGEADAWLFAAVESNRCTIITHDLYIGKPSRHQLLASLANAAAAPDFAGRPLSLSAAVEAYNLVDLSLDNGAELRRPSRGKAIVGGSIIKAVCGSSLGRIRIRTEPSRRSGYRPVTLRLAATVVGRLISELNSCREIRQRHPTSRGHLPPPQRQEQKAAGAGAQT